MHHPLQYTSWLLLSLLTSCAHAADVQALDGLLQQETDAQHARRAALEEWCSDAPSQLQQRRQDLLQLRSQARPSVEDEARISMLKQQLSEESNQTQERQAHMAESARAQKELNETLSDLSKEMAALSTARSRVQATADDKSPSFLPPASTLLQRSVVDERGLGLQVIDELQQEVSAQQEHSLQQRQQLPGDPTGDVLEAVARLEASQAHKRAELQRLQLQYNVAKQTDGIFMSALQNEDEQLADAKLVCSLGARIYDRLEQQVSPHLRDAMKQLLEEQQEAATTTAAMIGTSELPSTPVAAVIAAAVPTTSALPPVATATAPVAPVQQLQTQSIAPAANVKNTLQAQEAASTDNDDDDFSMSPPPRKLRARSRSGSTSSGVPASVTVETEAAKPPAEQADVTPPQEVQTPAHSQSSATGQTPHGLEGGWKSLLKAKKKGKQHKFKDETSGIMDLVQTPQSYTAWHPEGAEKAVAASTKDAVAEAEKAFDEDDAAESDKSSPASFLQIASSQRQKKQLRKAASSLAVKDESSAEAQRVASIVLEEYGKAADSASLLELAHARLSIPELERLWKGLQKGEALNEHDKDASQVPESAIASAQLCHSSGTAETPKASASVVSIDDELDAQRQVLEQTVALEGQIIALLGQGVESLAGLWDNTNREFNTSEAVVNGFMKAASGSGMENVGETLGRVAGVLAEGKAEVGDSMTEVLAKHNDAARERQSRLQELQIKLQDVKQRQVQSTQSDDMHAADAAKPELQDKYKLMCQFVEESMETRKRKQGLEKKAIRAALIVLLSVHP